MNADLVHTPSKQTTVSVPRTVKLSIHLQSILKKATKFKNNLNRISEFVAELKRYSSSILLIFSAGNGGCITMIHSHIYSTSKKRQKDLK